MPTTNSPQPRAPRRDATENREAILVAAAAALNEDIDASLETIAARAGLSRRAIYGHFATRDDLLAEVLTRGAAQRGRSARAGRASGCRGSRSPCSAPPSGPRWSTCGSARSSRFAARTASGWARPSSPPASAFARPSRAASPTARCARTSTRETVARLIESAAVAVLDEATRTGLTREAGPPARHAGRTERRRTRLARSGDHAGSPAAPRTRRSREEDPR